MAVRRVRRTNGRNLEEAIALLINNQAQFLGVAARIESEFAEIKRILQRHEQILIEHGNILASHSNILAGLPEAIREKIGFKAQA